MGKPGGPHQFGENVWIAEDKRLGRGVDLLSASGLSILCSVISFSGSGEIFPATLDEVSLSMAMLVRIVAEDRVSSESDAVICQRGNLR
jgi:hypothetical protein